MKAIILDMYGVIVKQTGDDFYGEEDLEIKMTQIKQRDEFGGVMNE